MPTNAEIKSNSLPSSIRILNSSKRNNKAVPKQVKTNQPEQKFIEAPKEEKKVHKIKEVINKSTLNIINPQYTTNEDEEIICYYEHDDYQKFYADVAKTKLSKKEVFPNDTVYLEFGNSGLSVIYSYNNNTLLKRINLTSNNTSYYNIKEPTIISMSVKEWENSFEQLASGKIIICVYNLIKKQENENIDDDDDSVKITKILECKLKNTQEGSNFDYSHVYENIKKVDTKQDYFYDTFNDVKISEARGEIVDKSIGFILKTNFQNLMSLNSFNKDGKNKINTCNICIEPSKETMSQDKKSNAIKFDMNVIYDPNDSEDKKYGYELHNEFFELINFFETAKIIKKGDEGFVYYGWCSSGNNTTKYFISAMSKNGSNVILLRILPNKETDGEKESLETLNNVQRK